MERQKIEIPVIADLFARGEKPEFLFWVGCAGAFDDRYKKVVRAFTKILVHLKVNFAVLGKEESCSGDPARRAGNEMLYQMQALRNIEIFEAYKVKKIITVCPHCYNIFRNEYPDLGGNYEVFNYLQFLNNKIKEGKLKLSSELFNDVSITYHDPCYLGRANNIYSEPRSILKSLTGNFVEMHRNRK
jgi:Fe-S oxidoreductase